MITKHLIQVTLTRKRASTHYGYPYAQIGVIVDKATNRIEHAPSIWHWAVGKDLNDVANWYLTRHRQAPKIGVHFDYISTWQETHREFYPQENRRAEENRDGR